MAVASWLRPRGHPVPPNDDDWVLLEGTQAKADRQPTTCSASKKPRQRDLGGTANGHLLPERQRVESDVNASQILISQDGNLQYLLETEIIQSIIIDAGNRKWVGTQGSGVRVGSGWLDHGPPLHDGKQPLPSNDVLDIAMDYGSGEVYLGTTKGLSVPRGGEQLGLEMTNFRAMPNPVAPTTQAPLS